MTSQNSIEFYSTIEFLSRDCKSKNHIDCKKIWVGIGIKVICNCECHDKTTVIGRDESLPNTVNLLSSKSEDYDYHS